MKSSFRQLKQQARKFFQQTKAVFCPAFPDEKVVFNSKGINHLLYKSGRTNRRRSKKEAAIRINLLPRAVKLLSLITLYQQDVILEFGEKRLKYWSLEGVIDNRRIKVIVRQVGKGNKHFWSVIPDWRKIGGRVQNAKSNLSKL